MLEFRLRQRLTPPGRQARLNTAHPFFSQQHVQCAQIAQGAGMVDLAGLVPFSTNTNTLSGVDEQGPYVTSATSDGTGALSVAGPFASTTYNFQTIAGIFKLGSGTGRQFPIGFNGNSGIWTNGQSINWYNNNGGYTNNFTGIVGHTYFAFWRSCPATAGLTRYYGLIDLNTGQVVLYTMAASNNLNVTTITALAVSAATVSNNRVYAQVICGSVLVPPSVTPQATFYSIDQIMTALADPWSLWYA